MRHGVGETFQLRLDARPVSSVAGGAGLWPDHVTCTIEPRGLVQFTQQSREVATDVTGSLAQVTAFSLTISVFLIRCCLTLLLLPGVIASELCSLVYICYNLINVVFL